MAWSISQCSSIWQASLLNQVLPVQRLTGASIALDPVPPSQVLIVPVAAPRPVLRFAGLSEATGPLAWLALQSPMDATSRDLPPAPPVSPVPLSPSAPPARHRPARHRPARRGFLAESAAVTALDVDQPINMPPMRVLRGMRAGVAAFDASPGYGTVVRPTAGFKSTFPVSAAIVLLDLQTYNWPQLGQAGANGVVPRAGRLDDRRRTRPAGRAREHPGARVLRGSRRQHPVHRLPFGPVAGLRMGPRPCPTHG
jgi:hypothetical protein